MKKTSKVKNELRHSILLLLLLAILLISSTYAWFTSNQVVSVTALDVNVEAKNGLQISLDAVNWKTIIQSSDIANVTLDATYPTNVNQVPKILEPVSTDGILDASGNGFLKMFYGIIKTTDTSNGEYVLASQKRVETKRGTSNSFIAFDLFLKVNLETQLYISKDSKVVFKDAQSKGMENATRVALVVEGNALETELLTDIQGLKTTDSSNVYIWEPNYDVHTAPAIANARNTYGITTSQVGADRISYDGISTTIYSDRKVLLGNANATMFPDLFNPIPTEKIYETPLDFANQLKNKQIFKIQPGITKVRVYMWIEGQDVDCENYASGSNISYELKLTSLDK